ncbi:hypothetical protein [Echinicola vietnamensis]|uniref:Uncharacterized protein n=1 Tax=Echinicola vietnamensis (strain DSM 17526 / LMG 23754 / KMM 6221) TaxID=926556 RepID=L0FUY7_ECHVK|nr:hypothetical protein [Echinicola vietnamensis]AGA77107.1 hypothetical protein Echvi_0834 [Echinicola vietnamensis DSM 17526]
MKKKIDILHQHFLVPTLLALASITLVMTLYFSFEWHSAAEVPEEEPFFTYREDVSSRAYQAEMGLLAVLFLGITVSCIGAVFMKHRLVGFVALAIGILGILYLAF